MSAIFDIIASIVLAGFVILLGLRMNATVANSNDSYHADVIVQENLVSLVQSLEGDFRRMGYHVIDPTQVILVADSTHIRFVADMYDNGIIDTVDWRLGLPQTFTPNPNDRILTRTIRPAPAGYSGILTSVPGVTVFSLRYLNQSGQPAISLGQIWIIETSLRVESPWKVQDREVLDQSYNLWGYSAAFWRQTRLASRNLKRHG